MNYAHWLYAISCIPTSCPSCPSIPSPSTNLSTTFPQVKGRITSQPSFIFYEQFTGNGSQHHPETVLSTCPYLPQFGKNATCSLMFPSHRNFIIFLFLFSLMLFLKHLSKRNSHKKTDIHFFPSSFEPGKSLGAVG